MSPETPPPESDAAPPPPPPPERPGLVLRLVRVVTGLVISVVLPLGVLAVSVHYGKRLLEDPPRALRRTRERHAPLVAVRAARFGHHPTTIAAMGTVVPSRVIELRPRVSGEIVETNENLVLGGRFRAGEVILRIDSTDYELAVRQREAELAGAESALRLEEGQQAVARREFELLGREVSEEERDLVLRRPQIAAARAEVAAAKAALERAKTDLARTVVHAPFNALIRSYDVDRGTQVSTSTRLATLESTDACYIEVPVPVDRLSWIRVKENGGDGATVRVHVDTGAGDDTVREGQVLRLVGDLEKSGRLARVLVSVEDPFALHPSNAGRPRLLYGAYLRVEIAGPDLEHAVALDRTVLRDMVNVWVADGEDRLRIRPAKVAHRTRDCVYVTGGIEDGDRIVVSNLPAPVEGMLLQVEEAADPGVCDSGRESDER